MPVDQAAALEGEATAAETEPLAAATTVEPEPSPEPSPEPTPEPEPDEPLVPEEAAEGVFVGAHMPLSNATQAKSVLTSGVVVNGMLQGAAWLCGGKRLHLMAALASGVHYVVLIHASGNVLGNERTERYFDLTGSLTYATLCGVALATAPGGLEALSHRQLLLGGMVLVWCLRLGSFLFLRIQKHGGIDPCFERPKKVSHTPHHHDSQ